MSDMSTEINFPMKVFSDSWLMSRDRQAGQSFTRQSGIHGNTGQGDGWGQVMENTSLLLADKNICFYWACITEVSRADGCRLFQLGSNRFVGQIGLQASKECHA